MKFSYSWIRELVPSVDSIPRHVEQLITKKTAECEGVEEVGFKDACLAQVLSVEPIAGGHNVKATVNTRYGLKAVLCGAPNCRAGLTTVYVPLGKKLIQGIESDGMLASASDLGINRDHSGILELFGDFAPLSDWIIEIDNKSITHRPDLWGHYGMAREVAAITGNLLVDPVHAADISAAAPISVAIADFELCPRYSALVFENVTVGPSPLWLQFRLTSIGLNPIDNIVDLTNYIMAELGQPMHAFDRALLHGETIFVRPAHEGETILALNDEAYDLRVGNLVIADAGGAVAIAGVIGGKESAISETTTSIVLESANFQASSVRKTSSALKLRTDASMRFEKAQDPVNTVRALYRAVELMRELSPGARLVGGLADAKREIPPPSEIRLSLEWLARKLGRELAASAVRDILERLGFGVRELTAGVFSVAVPSWRATKDVATPEDLVEEVGRMIGYDSIDPVAPLAATTVPPDDPRRMFLRSVRQTMAAQGFTEVSNYSFIGEEQARQFGFAPQDHVRVLNPIAAGQSLMRVSLLPGIYRNIVENRKHLEEFRLFEIGREIHKRAEGLPEEIPHLVAAIYAKDDGVAGLTELQRVAECLSTDLEIRQVAAHAYEHPQRSADLGIGRLFELHPSLIKGRASILDVDLSRLRPRVPEFKPVSRFPSSEFDLTISVPQRGGILEIQHKMRDFAGPLLDGLPKYLGQFENNASFRVTLTSPDRTLTSEEVAAVRQHIISGMRGLKYELKV